MKKAISRKNMKRTIRYTFLMSYFIICSSSALASDRWQELWSQMNLKKAVTVLPAPEKSPAV
ncbi:hypothetical protein, partial [Acidithiobacillus sp.]|uniref:hypothetical protein n=1 Tax=Acidithiobacillus sp. TaxID=1872118 RepID=UPI003CFE5CB0